MTWLSLSLALALSGAPAPSGPAPWRLVTTPSLHVGLRPAVLVTPDEVAAGVTIQVTVNAL